MYFAVLITNVDILVERLFVGKNSFLTAMTNDKIQYFIAINHMPSLPDHAEPVNF